MFAATQAQLQLALETRALATLPPPPSALAEDEGAGVDPMTVNLARDESQVMKGRVASSWIPLRHLHRLPSSPAGSLQTTRYRCV